MFEVNAIKIFAVTNKGNNEVTDKENMTQQILVFMNHDYENWKILTICMIVLETFIYYCFYDFLFGLCLKLSPLGFENPAWSCYTISMLFLEGKILGNCDKFYFTFKFKYQMWVQIFQKFEKDQIPICHWSN